MHREISLPSFSTSNPLAFPHSFHSVPITPADTPPHGFLNFTTWITFLQKWADTVILSYFFLYEGCILHSFTLCCVLLKIHPKNYSISANRELSHPTFLSVHTYKLMRMTNFTYWLWWLLTFESELKATWPAAWNFVPSLASWTRKTCISK